MGFPGDAIGGEDCPGLWALTSGTPAGVKILRRDLCGEDRHPEQEFFALAALGVAKTEFLVFAFTHWPRGYFMSNGPLYAGLIKRPNEWACFNNIFGHVKGITNSMSKISIFTSGQRPGEGCAYAKDHLSRSTS